eukprot:scaffold323_cov94-Isochrysis_galbana.AAC.7
MSIQTGRQKTGRSPRRATSALNPNTPPSQSPARRTHSRTPALYPLTPAHHSHSLSPSLSFSPPLSSRPGFIDPPLDPSSV